MCDHTPVHSRAVRRAGRPGMSGCKGSDGLGVGEGPPACLSLSGCLSSKKCVVFVPPPPLLRLFLNA